MPKNKNKVDPLDLVKKSAEKVAQTISSLYKQGGPTVYSQKVDGATNPKLLLKALDIVREKTEDKLCVLLVSCCNRNVYLLAYCPLGHDLHSLRGWLSDLAVTYDIAQFKAVKGHHGLYIDSAQFVPPGDTTPFKQVDTVLAMSCAYLRRVGLLTEDESDEENYAGQFEW